MPCANNQGVNAMLKGIGASSGIGIGKVLLIKEHDLSYVPKAVENVQSELARYQNAVEDFCSATLEKAERLKKTAGEKEAEILRGHVLMLQDPYMREEMEKLIESGQCAESALESVCDMFISIFSSTNDDLTNQRATDVKDIKNGILRILLGREEVDISKARPGTVLVTAELTPSMTAGICKENIAGIITQTGSKTSHSAILARALEIPAVLSLEHAADILHDGDIVILDGDSGKVLQSPDPAQLADYTAQQKAYLEERKALKVFIGKQTATKDGCIVQLAANIGTPLDAQAAFDNDCEGIGLFRTEFLFMDQTALPTEETQFEAYKKVALLMKGKPVIIRTLDIGGDKEIPYLGLQKEENPFLGFRAVRFCLKRTDIYKSQLRALLRASAYGDIRIMVPLVTRVEELRQVKVLLAQLKDELTDQGVPFNSTIPLGVMMETPASAVIADLLAKEADFFSIGTNDLTQYTMCADRGNANVAYLYSHYDPAVLRMIRRIIACAKDAGILAGMCGEAAADPLLIPLLISFGLEEYSVSPTSILATRKAIAAWSKEEADLLAQKVMSLSTQQEVLRCLTEHARR